MARKRSARTSDLPADERTGIFDLAATPPERLPTPETTGRLICTFLDPSDASVKSALASIKSKAGIATIAHSADFQAAEFDPDTLRGTDGLVLDELGIAIMSPDPDQAQSMVGLQADRNANMVVEPEYINYALSLSLDEDVLDRDEGPRPSPERGPSQTLNLSLDFLRGYRAAVDQLIEHLMQGDVRDEAAETAAAAFRDTGTATWGLQATRVVESRFSGRGIRVAVLDTGFDFNHPDFTGRVIESRSFISGEAVQDGNGHGTHCIGTACGSLNPGSGPRYGVAYDSEIFAGKVLSNGGRGGDGSILAGINWALQNGCQVVSMSLGRPVRRGERPTQAYETAGRRAMEAGTLLVAAAGNESGRPLRIEAVGSPANAGSIVAVAALDANLTVARFSNRGINPAGGEINLAAPGVSVLSSWPMPTRLRSINGTSMATPHVAGIAALIAEEVPSVRGILLYHELRRRVRVLPLPRADVGNGLVEAI